MAGACVIKWSGLPGVERCRVGRLSALHAERDSRAARVAAERHAWPAHDADATAVFGGLNLRPQQLGRVHRMILTACGTSWHAALLGEYLIEELARIPVEVEYASELRYRNPPLDNQTAVVRHYAKRRDS